MAVGNYARSHAGSCSFEYVCAEAQIESLDPMLCSQKNALTLKDV
jgi:hypothetical protein